MALTLYQVEEVILLVTCFVTNTMIVQFVHHVQSLILSNSDKLDNFESPNIANG
jgi:hypothetical protein